MENAAGDDFAEVDDEGQCEEERAELVKEEDSAEALGNFGQADRPRRAAEAQRQSGGGEAQKCGEEDSMEVALAEGEAQEVAGLFRSSGLGCDGCFGSGSRCSSDWIRHFFLPAFCCFPEGSGNG